MNPLKKRIAEFLLLVIFFSGLITFAYSQKPEQCPSDNTWMDARSLTAICNVPDCYEAMDRINKTLSFTLVILVAYTLQVLGQRVDLPSKPFFLEWECT